MIWKVLRYWIISQVVILYPAYSQSWISTVIPEQYFTNADKNCIIQIVFTEDIDPSSITNESIIVHATKSARHSSDSISYSPLNRTATLIPNREFIIGEDVTVTVTESIINNSGASMPAPFVWSFMIKVESGKGQFCLDSTFSPNITDLEEITSADFDRDGDLDFALISLLSHKVMIFMNDGSGQYSLSDTINIGNPVSLAQGDWDCDGDMDLALTASPPGGDRRNFWTLMNDGTGNFLSRSDTIISGQNLFHIEVGDWNGDGHLDLLVVDGGGLAPGGIYILMNDGNGHFDETENLLTGYFWMYAATGDWDLDGDLDLVTTASLTLTTGFTKVYYNDGNGNFIDGPFLSNAPYPGFISASNLDGDFDIDLITSSGQVDSLYLLLNNGNGGFLLSEGVSGTGRSVIGDWDADGDLDLATVKQMIPSPAMIKFADNNGSAIFNVYDSISVPYQEVRSLTYGDWDLDGDLDLALINRHEYYTQGFVTILLNQKSLGIQKLHKEVLTHFTLYPNYPNPFNSETIIKYDLYNSGNVDLSIYDPLGQLIVTIINEYQLPGSYQFRWNGVNSKGHKVSSGIYFCRLKNGDFFVAHKLLLLE